MEINQKGFVNIILIVVVVALVGVVGYFTFVKKPELITQQPTPAPTTTQANNPDPISTPQNKNKIVYDNKNSIESNGYKFWEALSKGNISEFSNFYADEVWLLGGSELLKNEWGLNPSGDRSKDLLLKKSMLLSGYKQMIDLIGKDKWAGISSKLNPSFSSAKESRLRNESIKEDDVIMQVPVNSSNVLFFVLRRINQDVKVVMELTDY